MQRDYYVYVHKHKSDGEIFYIGKGTKDRYKDISGRSDDWEVYVSSNEWYAEVVIDNLTSDEADFKERELITQSKDNELLLNKSWVKAKPANSTGILGVCFERKSKLKFRKRTNDYKEEVTEQITAHIYDVSLKKQLTKTWSIRKLGYEATLEMAKKWRQEKELEMLERQNNRQYISYDYLANRDEHGNILLYSPDGTFVELVLVK